MSLGEIDDKALKKIKLGASEGAIEGAMLELFVGAMLKVVALGFGKPDGKILGASTTAIEGVVLGESDAAISKLLEATEGTMLGKSETCEPACSNPNDGMSDEEDDNALLGASETVRDDARLGACDGMSDEANNERVFGRYASASPFALNPDDGISDDDVERRAEGLALEILDCKNDGERLG
jgi:hypothetical protein